MKGRRLCKSAFRGRTAAPRPAGRASSVPVLAVAPIPARAVGDDDLEGGAGAGGVDERDAAAMGAEDFRGDGEAEAGAARAGAALEGLEEMAACPFGDAGAGVADADLDVRPVARGRDGQPAYHGGALVAAIERLHRVAGEIDEDAEELVRIGIDL